MINKKNIIKISITLCFAVLFSFIGINNADAATYKIAASYCNSYTYNYTPYYKYVIYSTKDLDSKNRFSIQYSTSPSRIVYCLQKGVTIKKGSKSYSKKSTATSDTMYGNIAKAIAYGKNGTSGIKTCSDERIATSMLVQMLYKGYTTGPHHWKTITNTQVKSMIKTGNKASIASYFIAIRDKILKYDTMPFEDFASESKATAQANAKYFKHSSTNDNFTLSLSDDILNENWGWTISSKDEGITSATISDGKLTVKAGTDTKGKNLCVRIRKTVKTGDLYASTATNQQTALLINPENTYKYTYVCFKSNYASVKKVDADNENKVLSGAKFRIYSDSSCKTAATNVHGSSLTENKITDNSGYAYFYNLSDGKYYIKETQSPSQYVLDETTCRPITISSGKGTVTFKNRKITSTSVQVFKNDKYDKSGIAGVKIGLYSDDKCSKLSTLVPSTSQIKTTDSSGMVIWQDIDTTNITSYPHYLYVKEEKSSIPSGYIAEKENDCKKVSISKSDVSSGTTTEEIKNSVVIYNIPYGNLKILKLDEDTREPLEKVTFKLLDQNKKEVKDKDGNIIKEITTDKNGIATFKNVPYGIYYIKETKSNPKYKFIEQLYLFELNKNTDSIKLAKLAEIPYVIGDVTIDNIVNQDDLTELTNMLKDEKLLIGLEKKKQYSSDANNDGILDENDGKILEYYINYKDDISLYTNSIKTLCNGKTECALDKTLLKNILGVSTINDKTSTTVCYETVTVNPEPSDTPETEAYEPSLTNEDNINACQFTDKSLEYLNEAITNNNTSNLNADFNDDKIIDSKDSQILAAYLEYDKSNKIAAVTNYLGALDKIGSLDASTIEKIQKIGTNSAIPSEEVHASIVITNKPIDMKISKLDITNAQEIKGAKIVIKDSEGKTFIEFTSSDTAKQFQIPAGVYTLIETVAPKGFQNLETEIKFRVGIDGNISILSGNDDLYELVKSQKENDTDLDHLKIYNVPIQKKIIKVPDTGSVVSIITLVTGTILIAAGGYFIYKKYKTN